MFGLSGFPWAAYALHVSSSFAVSWLLPARPQSPYDGGDTSYEPDTSCFQYLPRQPIAVWDAKCHSLQLPQSVRCTSDKPRRAIGTGKPVPFCCACGASQALGSVQVTLCSAPNLNISSIMFDISSTLMSEVRSPNMTKLVFSRSGTTKAFRSPAVNKHL